MGADDGTPAVTAASSLSVPGRLRGVTACHEVKLWNAVSREDVLDPDEAEEALADLCFLCEAYGLPSAASIEPMPPHTHTKVARCLPAGTSYGWLGGGGGASWPELCSGSSIDGLDSKMSFPVAFVRCSDVTGALQAAERLQGTVMGGQRVDVSLYDCNALDKGLLRSEHVIALPRAAHPAGTQGVCAYGLRVWLRVGSEGEWLGGEGYCESTWLAAKSCTEQSLRCAVSGACDKNTTHVTRLLQLIGECGVLVPLGGQADGVDGVEIVLGPFDLADCVLLQGVLASIHMGSMNDLPIDAARFDVCAISEAPKKVWSSGRSVLVKTLSRSWCRGIDEKGEEGMVLQDGCVLAVSGYLSEDDVLDAVTFPEEVTALKRDLMEVLGLYTPSSSKGGALNGGEDTRGWLYCRSCFFVTEDLASAIEGNGEDVLAWASEPFVRLEFTSAEVARNVMFAFDGSVLGGEVVVAMLTENEKVSLEQGNTSGVPQTTEAVGSAVTGNGSATEAPKLPKHTAPAHSFIPVRYGFMCNGWVLVQVATCSL